MAVLRQVLLRSATMKLQNSRPTRQVWSCMTVRVLILAPTTSAKFRHPKDTGLPMKHARSKFIFQRSCLTALKSTAPLWKNFMIKNCLTGQSVPPSRAFIITVLRVRQATPARQILLASQRHRTVSRKKGYGGCCRKPVKQNRLWHCSA